MCFSARRASSCNMHRPSLNGCSAPSSCCFTEHLPLSSPAYREIPWRCWLEEGHWDLLGENTRWTHWEGPVHTRSHTHTNLKTCPCFSPLAHLDATHSACLFLSNSGCRMSLIIHLVHSHICLKLWNEPGLCSHRSLQSGFHYLRPQGWRSAAIEESSACMVLTPELGISKGHVCILHVAQVWNQIFSPTRWPAEEYFQIKKMYRSTLRSCNIFH